MRHFNYNVVKIRTEDGKEWQGIPALHGKTLYETALEHGFEGTEDEWFELLIGDGWITPLQNFRNEYDDYVRRTNQKIEDIEARKINGHAFNTDVQLVPDDVGAADKTFSNVTAQAFAAKAKEAGFDAGGVIATQTIFNEDGSITENSSDGSSKTTVFNDDGSITENYTLATGDQVQKVITFNDDGSISETVTEVANETTEE